MLTKRDLYNIACAVCGMTIVEVAICAFVDDVFFTMITCSNILKLFFIFAILKKNFRRNDNLITAIKKVIDNGDKNVNLDDIDTMEILNLFKDLRRSSSALLQRIQKASIQVTACSTGISITFKQVHSAVENFVETTGIISNDSNSISETSSSLLKTMENISQVSQDTQSLAIDGKDGLERIESMVVLMENSFNSIVSKLESVQKNAANINSITVTITKIADQTNVLSLNASIEAEKAGEFGKGFAVIAGEMRRLSDQTAIFTLDIEKMITDVKVAIEDVVNSIGKFYEKLTAYVKEIKEVTNLLVNIINGVENVVPKFVKACNDMEQQSLQSKNINKCVKELYNVAKQTKNSVEESKEAISKLNEATRNMHKEVTSRS